jgi:transposase
LPGLQGIGHVIADAAYDADLQRIFIADDLGATAHIKANSSRTKKPTIDRTALQRAASNQILLRQNQTLPKDRPALQENHLSLNGLRLSRLCHDMASINADNTWLMRS